MRPKNPWLDIRAGDYEGHMDLPGVDQLAPLREIFREALDRFSPEKAAIVGCATGNGIGEVDFSRVKKLHALDINPRFLEILRDRYARHLDKIETTACDLDNDDPGLSGIDLVFAALIFEYVETDTVLGKIEKWLRPGGALVAVLQLPCDTIPEISPSPFRSLEKLAPVMKLADPEKFIGAAARCGLKLSGRKARKLRSGKEFLELCLLKEISRD